VASLPDKHAWKADGYVEEDKTEKPYNKHQRDIDRYVLGKNKKPKTKKRVNKQFDSTLGYPGEGPIELAEMRTCDCGIDCMIAGHFHDDNAPLSGFSRRKKEGEGSGGKGEKPRKEKKYVKCVHTANIQCQKCEHAHDKKQRIDSVATLTFVRKYQDEQDQKGERQKEIELTPIQDLSAFADPKSRAITPEPARLDVPQSEYEQAVKEHDLAYDQYIKDLDSLVALENEQELDEAMIYIETPSVPTAPRLTSAEKWWNRPAEEIELVNFDRSATRYTPLEDFNATAYPVVTTTGETALAVNSPPLLKPAGSMMFNNSCAPQQTISKVYIFTTHGSSGDDTFWSRFADVVLSTLMTKRTSVVQNHRLASSSATLTNTLQDCFTSWITGDRAWFKSNGKTYIEHFMLIYPSCYLGEVYQECVDVVMRDANLARRKLVATDGLFADITTVVASVVNTHALRDFWIADTTIYVNTLIHITNQLVLRGLQLHAATPQITKNVVRSSRITDSPVIRRIVNAVRNFQPAPVFRHAGLRITSSSVDPCFA